MTEEKNETGIDANEKEAKKNRRLLRFFCVALEFIGWAQVFVGIMWFMYLFSGSRATSVDMAEAFAAISGYSFDFVFLGLTAIILAHLARYVSDRDFRRSVLLRCGDKILYLFAVFTVVWAIFRWFYYLKTIEGLHWKFLLAQPLMLPTIAKVLILVCLGQILKRIMPVIEESKTLV